MAAPGLDRQSGLGAVKRLDLAILAERQHHGMDRRIDIEPDDVGKAWLQAGIARALEGAQAVRLQFVRLPDALHRAQRESERQPVTSFSKSRTSSASTVAIQASFSSTP
jgi:hypothetical protein